MHQASQTHHDSIRRHALVGAWVLVTECTSIEQLDSADSEFYVDGRDNQSRFTGDGMLYAALHRE